MSDTKRLLPGYHWRVQAFEDDGDKVEMESRGCIDEVVIDGWFHLEQMDARKWCIQVGDARIDVHVYKNGNASVNVTRGDYGDVRGWTQT
jgi:hypothetical protein